MSGHVKVQFERIRAGGEFWGGTQADFLLVPDSGRRREVCIVLSDAAAADLAEKTSVENTEAFRAEVAHQKGEVYLQAAISSNRLIAPSVLVTPEMLAALAG